ncbi:MAG: ROK family protein [Bdellovibrionales bacterium]
MIAALDIGGTKVHGAIVDEQGKILRQERQPVLIQKGPDAFFRQLGEILNRLSAGFPIDRVGIGCAGPLDSVTGELLDPTNFFTGGKSWGRLSLLKPLQAQFKNWQFYLDNDAAAAVLGEAWLGGGATKNLAVITLGTGVGIGVLRDGRPVRSRGELHPEAGHFPLNFEAPDMTCGCGNNGCVEAYLGVPHFVRRLGEAWGLKDFTGEMLVAMADKGDARALEAFKNYGEWLAQTIRSLAVLYGPEQVSLTGGFAHTAKWFLPTVEKRLPEMLKRYREGVDLLPKVQVSRLGDDLSVLGAARVGLQHQSMGAN